jgi:hypothetical protein
LGNYDLIGRLTTGTAGVGSPSNRQASPGEFTMGVANATGGGLSYTLTAPAGIFPAGGTTSSVRSPQISWDINSTVAYRYTHTYGDTPQYLGERLAGFGGASQLFSYDYTRGGSGSAKDIDAKTYAATDLSYDIGNSYVAMGEWSWAVVDNTHGQPVTGTGYGSLVFVNGDRTPTAGIPASGTAAYDARTLFGFVNVPFSLVADFGQRTMSTSIAQDYRYNPAGDSMDNPLAFGIHVSGSAPFSSAGLFDIPLTGTVNWANSYAINTPMMPAAEPVSGAMNGAFFGPHAEQVGGTLFLARPGGAQLMQDAFIGQQRP